MRCLGRIEAVAVVSPKVENEGKGLVVELGEV